MKYALVAIYEIALFALIGFLCWLFHNGLPCLLVLLAGITVKGGDIDA